MENHMTIHGETYEGVEDGKKQIKKQILSA